MQTNTCNVVRDVIDALYVFITFMLLSRFLHVMNTVHFHRSESTQRTLSSAPQ